MTTLHNSSGTLADVREWARQQGYSVKDRGQVPPMILKAYSAAVREWARDQGISLGNRGRIPGDVVGAFNTAVVRKARPSNHRTVSEITKSRPHTTRQIREAARKAGYSVGERGRLPRKVIKEFVGGRI